MEKKEILKRLAECRRCYQEKMSEEDELLLLENTMVAVQDLLAIEQVAW